jgi:hypothetical protein
MTGIKAATVGTLNAGLPSDQNQYPRIVLTPTGMTYTRGTFGPNGKVSEDYGIVITLYLGTADMSYEGAINAALPFLDRVRAAFASDGTLGGRCINSDITDQDDTLDNFKEPGAPFPMPALRWVLGVSEEVAANA